MTCMLWIQDHCNHEGVIKWKHFPRYWPIVRGIHRSPVSSPHKGQWRGALTFSLICVWINGWINNGEAGDLRRYCAHYDVTVMMLNVAVWQTMLCDRPCYDEVKLLFRSLYTQCVTYGDKHSSENSVISFRGQWVNDKEVDFTSCWLTNMIFTHNSNIISQLVRTYRSTNR